MVMALVLVDLSEIYFALLTYLSNLLALLTYLSKNSLSTVLMVYISTQYSI